MLYMVRTDDVEQTKESNIKDCLVAPDWPLLIIILYTPNLCGGYWIQLPDSQLRGTPPCKVYVDVAISTNRYHFSKPYMIGDKANKPMTAKITGNSFPL